MNNLKPSIGLGLCGGAAKGMAHIGILTALHENQIDINYISGTSIGSLIGALYAFGVPLKDLRRTGEEMTWSSISSLAISKSGLFTNKAIGQIIEKFLGDAKIEEAPIPLAIVATDICNGEKIIIREGSVAQAVMASSCVPGIFTPVEINNRLLVDGFLVENVPLSPLKNMGADIIIAINLSSLRDYREPSGMINILMNAYEIVIDTNTIAAIEEADILIEPLLADISADDPNEPEALFSEGHTAGLLALPKIKSAIERVTKQSSPKFWGRLRNIVRSKHK